MEELVRSVVLGIIQGLTEFLPVSSSGHLELAKYLLGDEKVGEESLLMTVTLHFATALSTIVVFRKDILAILKGLLQFQWSEESRFALKIIVSMIPAALAGIFLEAQIEQMFSKQILLVGLCLLLTAILLFFADRAKATDKDVTYRSAFWVGVAQMIAILPGLSRSGATVSASVLLGIDRSRAARFSFLMVVPLILGKIAKDLMDGSFQAQSKAEFLPLALGFIAAFLTGLLACTWMIQLVKRSKLGYFSLYCLIVAILAIGLYFFNESHFL